MDHQLYSIPHGQLTVRAFNPQRDTEGLRACFIDLQDHEHSMASSQPTGGELVDSYVPFMVERVRQNKGRLFIAERDGEVVGFVTALVCEPEAPDDTDAFYVEIGELSVRKHCRSLGVGQRLIDAAEAFARKLKAPSLRVSTWIQNNGAQRLYGRNGFAPLVVMLEKRLGAES